jgi:hypothetical protein
MVVSTHKAVATLVATALAGSAAVAVTASGREGNGSRGGHNGVTVLETSLAPSVPGDPMLNGVNPGGAPWVLRQGEVRLRHDGRLRVRIRGLVIPTAPSNGTPGPVMTVNASLYCGASTTAVGTTMSVPISRRGNADLAGRMTLPGKCLAPTVLIHPNGMGSVYIAADGFGG